MNKCYKTVRNRKTGQWVAVGENARTAGARAVALVSAVVGLCITGNAHAGQYLNADDRDGQISSTVTYDSMVIGSTGVASTNVGSGVQVTSSGKIGLGTSSAGNGTLNVSGEGSKVTSGNELEIGQVAGGTGLVTLTDGAALQVSGAINVGQYGNGTLNVTNGGTASVAGWLSIADQGTATGVVTVSGQGSTMTQSGSGPRIMVGNHGGGKGTLNVLDGGTVNGTGLTVGEDSASSGTVVVDGTGSTLAISGDIIVGHTGTASGTLTVSNGGIVSSGSGISVAANSGTTGIVNVGAAAGDAAVAPGTLNVGTVTFGSGTGTLNFNHTSDSYVFSPSVSGAGTVNVLAGTTTLAGNNTYTGDTIISGGTLKAGSSTAFGQDSATTIGSAGTLDLNGFGNSLGSLNGSGVVTNTGSTAATLTVGSNGVSTTFGGTIEDGSATIALTKTGAGALTLTGANSYSGITAVSAGTLALSGAGSIASSSELQLSSGATLDISGTTNGASIQSIDSNAGSEIVLGGQTLTLNSSAALLDYKYPLVNGYGGYISNILLGTLSDGGAGGGLALSTSSPVAGNYWMTLLQGQQTYTGATTIGAGTALVLDGETGTQASIANSSNVTVNGMLDISTNGVFSSSGSTINVASATTTIKSLSGSSEGIVALGNQNLTLSQASGTFAGTITDDSLMSQWSVAGINGYQNSGSLTILSGTETLTGSNTYSGGTFLKGGQLNVGTNTALGTGTLDMADGTTLGFAADGLNVGNAIVLSGTGDPTIDTGSYTETLSGNISGTGDLTKTGSGTLITTGANTYTGATTVAAGTLQAGAANTFSSASAYTVASGATLALAGYDQTVASLSNAGTVSFHAAGDVSTGTTLTVVGDYVGNGGSIAMNTVLGDSSSSTDLVKIGGNASGTTTLAVTNAGGLGALTTGSGIELVDVAGTSTSDAFSLSGKHVDAGAYAYYLYKGDASGSGNDWYLRSQAISPDDGGTTVVSYRREVPMYAAVPAQLRAADQTLLGDMHKRMGETPAGEERMGWARIIASNSQIGQSGAAQAESNGHFAGLQVGSDLWRGAGWRVGGYAGYLRGDLDVSGFALGTTGAVGSLDTNTYVLGAYGTRSWDDGTYLDLVLQGAHHSVDALPDGGSSSSMSGKGLTASAEIGKPFALGASGWSIEPQAQVLHQWLNLNDATLSGATTVGASSTNGWLFRLGARLKGEYDTRWGKTEPYARVNVYHAPKGSDQLTYTTTTATTTLGSGAGYTSTELAAGATLALARNVKAYGEIGRVWSNGGDARVSSTVQGSIGVRVNW